MVRRKDKRNKIGDTNFFLEFMKIKEHFFKEFNVRLKRVKDRRHSSYIKYPAEVILFMIILKNIFNLETMRNMSESMNKEECIDNVALLLGLDWLDELPHYDTINNFLSELRPEELEKIRTYMIKELLKKRCLEGSRINDTYWAVIFDGTGLFHFNEKHCEHCLKREHTNEKTGEKKIIYMHHVLEAKLLVGDMVFSIGSEFIENESENVTKQDCELKAFDRLTEKIKRTYPRLPLCVLGDSLYACETIFKRCDEYHWKYLIRFKEGRIKSIATEFDTIKSIEKKMDEKFFWTNGIAYNQRTVNMFEANIEIEDNDIRTYTFITNLHITAKKAEEYIEIGRDRWKIENQGFKNQKKIRYHIEHANCRNYTAMKNHYLLTQIADILMQLYENGCRLLREIRKTAKEISSDLLEAIRTRKITDEDILQLAKPAQVRFT
ncbi:MAG: transposase family protein [Candidatus Methanofastidiosa archaeon]|jgi:hypothetical protein|nr:transposase family protein [Candidatus Methanofastidiosa archaeon]